MKKEPELKEIGSITDMHGNVWDVYCKGKELDYDKHFENVYADGIVLELQHKDGTVIAELTCEGFHDFPDRFKQIAVNQLQEEILTNRHAEHQDYLRDLHIDNQIEENSNH